MVANRNNAAMCTACLSKRNLTEGSPTSYYTVNMYITSVPSQPKGLSALRFQ